MSVPGWKLGSLNIQAGLATHSYRDYVLGAREHLRAHGKSDRLHQIAGLLKDLDVVGLQEADPGSRRSGFENQAHVIASVAGFEHVAYRANRRLGQWAGSGVALLSRHRILESEGWALPSPLPGRGLLRAVLDHPDGPLPVWVVHLSLGVKTQGRQLESLLSRLGDAKRVVIMGDFNCETTSTHFKSFLDTTGLKACGIPTYPSWKPSKGLDHIVCCPSLQPSPSMLLETQSSDHLGITRIISKGTNIQP